MFPVKVTLNELPGQVFVSVPFVSISTPFLDIMNFIETPYHLYNVLITHGPPVYHYFIN